MITNFNSIKVQLKPYSEFGENMRQFLFQFYKGTIKTKVTKTFNVYAMEFQFHKGTIKTYPEFKNYCPRSISIP